jgi:hypothetical protein
MAHYVINAFSLGGWAGGNIILLLNTYYTTWLTIFSVLLLQGEPSMMMSPYNFRLGLFICSALTVSLFFGNMITIFIKYLAGTTPTDSFGEVISLYVLVLQFGAFIPASFIFLYDGLALTPYSIFNSQYGHWDDIVLPG